MFLDQGSDLVQAIAAQVKYEVVGTRECGTQVFRVIPIPGDDFDAAPKWSGWRRLTATKMRNEHPLAEKFLSQMIANKARSAQNQGILHWSSILHKWTLVLSNVKN